jgi:diaminopimelate epimerase
MLPFAKAHAYGNDFLYVRSADVEGADLARLTTEICDRHTGVGADGLIVYGVQMDLVTMRLYNADGGAAEVSGNGVRALGALVLDESPELTRSVVVRTAAGDKRLTRLSREGRRQVFLSAMGIPAGLRRLDVPVLGEVLQTVVLDMGNPQCVLLGPLPDDDRFERLGPALERHPLFPAGTNVEFVEIVARDRLRIRIWERGCGPTSSSGTGSCASLVAAAAFGGADRDAEVSAPGGAQRVEWREDGVYLTGWAEVVCRGRWLRPLVPAIA